MNDAAKMWKCWDGRVGLIGGFGAWGALKDSEIAAVLAKRDEAKALRDYATADKLRDELNARGIEVYDSTREWRCSDGRSGTFGHSGGGGGGGEADGSGGAVVSVRGGGMKRGRSQSGTEGPSSSSASASAPASAPASPSSQKPTASTPICTSCIIS